MSCKRRVDGALRRGPGKRTSGGGSQGPIAEGRKPAGKGGSTSLTA